MKLAFLNTENLFLSHTDSTLNFKNKALNKTKWLARTIKEMDPDILSLCEVGGEESLHLFNEKYLNSDYYHSLIPGNSDRNIQLAFLIKKTLPFRYEHFTHRNRKLGFHYPHESKKSSHYMSRDIAELRLFNKDNKNNASPIVIILNLHLKSKIDKEGLDWNGRKRRAAEVELTVKTYLTLKSRFPSTPIFVMGDFNGIARAKSHDLPNIEEEFSILFEKTDLRDLLDLMDLPEEQRFTFPSFSKDKKPNHQQLDYIFIPTDHINSIHWKNSGIYYYRDEEGQPLPFPQTPHQRMLLPSDHYPLLIDVDELKKRP